MKPIAALTLATALALAVALPAAAQTTAPAATPATVVPAGGVTPSAEMAEGEIRRVNKDTGKLTIKHGPIKSLDMPPMTMVFTAKDPAMLERVAVGDKVRFVVVDQGGQMVVTELQSAK